MEKKSESGFEGCKEAYLVGTFSQPRLPATEAHFVLLIGVFLLKTHKWVLVATTRVRASRKVVEYRMAFILLSTSLLCTASLKSSDAII